MGTIPTAAKSLLGTEVNAPRFAIVTKALGATTDASGRRRFRATASSTIQDRQGDQISLKALEQMRDRFREGVTIFTDHENKVANAFGTTDGAEIIQRGHDPKSGMPIYDLDIEGGVNEPNPNAVQLHDSIAGGYVRLGCSIDAFVTDHKPKQAGRYAIDGLDVFAASIVGVPMNQRSWTQKAVRAIKGFTGDAEEEDVPEDQIEAVEASEAVVEAEKGLDDCVDCGETVEKGDMSAKTRNDLPDSAFACPEKRKYPINDKAHIRAALSRIADPSNDQCGRDKILAAARREGIGDHEQKSLMSDEELLAWAAANPADIPEDFDEVIEKAIDTGNSAALDRQDLAGSNDTCPTCGHPEPCNCTDCACEADGHHAASDTDNDGDNPAAGYDPDHDGKSIDAIADAALTKGTTEGGQEADPAATPETAPSTDIDGTDTAAVRKAAAFESEDVVVLVKHVQSLVTTIGQRDETITMLSKELTEAKTERDRLAEENEIAKRVIEKVMSLPLRPKTVGYVNDLSKRLPDFIAPEVRNYLDKTAGEK